MKQGYFHQKSGLHTVNLNLDIFIRQQKHYPSWIIFQLIWLNLIL